MLQINSKHLVEWAASEPRVVVEVVVHRAHLMILYIIRYILYIILYYSEPWVVVEVVVHRAHPRVAQGVRHTRGRPTFDFMIDSAI